MISTSADELHRAIQIWERTTQDYMTYGNDVIITIAGRLNSGFYSRRLLIPAIGHMLDLHLDTVVCLGYKVRINTTLYLPYRYPVAVMKERRK